MRKPKVGDKVKGYRDNDGSSFWYEVVKVDLARNLFECVVHQGVSGTLQIHTIDRFLDPDLNEQLIYNTKELMNEYI